MFEDMFIHFDRLYQRDRQTDTQTHTPHDDIGRACIASRGKNGEKSGDFLTPRWHT